jgi:O-acetyl-ADP-ribose deacetylase (regulator of RNase III)
MEVAIGRAKLSLIPGDITRQRTEAIVNAANSGLMGGGGVDGAIHRAGGPAILEECRRIRADKGPLPTGKAVITTGGKLAASYVIHTVGPIWHGGMHREAELLASAYRESLKLAADKGIKTISFPSISTGAYGYPVEEAAAVALKTVAEFLQEDTSLQEVTFVLFDTPTYEVYTQVLKDLIQDR